MVNKCWNCRFYEEDNNTCSSPTYCDRGLLDARTESYCDGYKQGRVNGIETLCDVFKANWENQCDNGIEDCINWSDWLNDIAAQILEQE